MSLLLDTPSRTPTDLTGRTVLVLHAHPDDEAIFTGATIRRLADRGARVVLVTATGGELGTPRTPLPRGRTIAQVRTAELERSADLLGVSRLVLLGRRDSGLPGWESGDHPQAWSAPTCPGSLRRWRTWCRASVPRPSSATTPTGSTGTRTMWRCT